MTRFQFVADHQHAFEVKRMCQVLAIAKSSYYAWVRAADKRAAGSPETPRSPSGSVSCRTLWPGILPTGSRG